MGIFKTGKRKPANRPAFLDEEYELVYKFDVESLLAYYKGVDQSRDPAPADGDKSKTVTALCQRSPEAT